MPWLYLVFERFPLEDYGNRIPQFQFEVVRAVGSVASDLNAVALIPGATEFGLSPQLVTDEPSKGETRGLNRNCLKAQETGLELTWRIGASGEDFSDQFFSTTTSAGGLRALQPLEPVHVRSQIDSNGDMHVSWIRRGRIDADSWLAADIPIGEEREAYHIEIRNNERLVRSVDVDRSSWTYSVTDRLADFGDLQAEIDFSVAMMSAAVGQGRAARCKLPFK